VKVILQGDGAMKSSPGIGATPCFSGLAYGLSGSGRLVLHPLAAISQPIRRLDRMLGIFGLHDQAERMALLLTMEQLDPSPVRIMSSA